MTRCHDVGAAAGDAFSSSIARRGLVARRRLGTVLTYGCVVATLVSAGGCKQEDRKVEAPRPVRTVIATPGAISDEIAQTGEIQPHTETDLGFRIAGRVATRRAEVGTTVAKDQLLATLDPEDVQNEVRSAEAEQRSAESSEALARSNLDRQRTLFEKGIVAPARMEEAEANWRNANARKGAVQANLEGVRNRLTYTELRAPDEGIVSAIGVNAGQVVNAGQMVVKLASTRERDAVFNVSERLINAAPDDVRVEVALASDPTVKVVGPIRDVSPMADAATRSYRVRVALPDAPPTMTFGATVTGRVALSGNPLIPLPASAMTSADGKPAVFVVDRARQELVRKPVAVARYTAAQVLVASGVSAGEAVVTAGVSKLRPGQKVAADADQDGATR